MAHKMFLVTADLSKIHLVVVAKKASVAQAAEHPLRKREVEVSSTSAGSTWEPPDAA